MTTLYKCHNSSNCLLHFFPLFAPGTLMWMALFFHCISKYICKTSKQNKQKQKKRFYWVFLFVLFSYVFHFRSSSFAPDRRCSLSTGISLICGCSCHLCSEEKTEQTLYKTKRYKTSFNLLQSDKKYFPLFNITKKVVILFDLFDTRCL